MSEPESKQNPEPESEPESEQDSDYEDPYMTSLNRDYAVKLILLVLKNEFTENSTFLKCVAPDYVPDKHNLVLHLIMM